MHLATIASVTTSHIQSPAALWSGTVGPPNLQSDQTFERPYSLVSPPCSGAAGILWQLRTADFISEQGSRRATKNLDPINEVSHRLDRTIRQVFELVEELASHALHVVLHHILDILESFAEVADELHWLLRCNCNVTALEHENSERTLLKGSWDLVTRVIVRVTILITQLRYL